MTLWFLSFFWGGDSVSFFSGIVRNRDFLSDDDDDDDYDDYDDYDNNNIGDGKNKIEILPKYAVLEVLGLFNLFSLPI